MLCFYFFGHVEESFRDVSPKNRFVNLFFFVCFVQLPRLAGPLRALVRDMVII